ncbi:hypothetical protein AB0M86_43940, partial [Streptomyces sp. NPDC051639]
PTPGTARGPAVPGVGPPVSSRRQLREAAGGRPVQVAAEPIGGAIPAEPTGLPTDGGTLLTYGGLAEGEPMGLDAVALTSRGPTVRGVTNRAVADRRLPRRTSTAPCSPRKSGPTSSTPQASTTSLPSRTRSSTGAPGQDGHGSPHVPRRLSDESAAPDFPPGEAGSSGMSARSPCHAPQGAIA